MRKIITLLLVGIMLLSMFAVPAFADEIDWNELMGLPSEDEPSTSTNMFDAITNDCIADYNNVVYAPILKYHETESGNFITATYMPDLFTQLLIQPNIQAKYNITEWTTNLIIDYKWNDDIWLSAKEQIDEFSANFLNQTFHYEDPILEPTTVIIFDLRRYNPALDKEGVYKDIIFEKDGKWAIDFTKNTLEVRFAARFASRKSECEWMGGSSTLKVVTQETLPSTLSAPNIGSAHFNNTTQTVYWQLLANDEIRNRIQFGETFHTVMRYQYMYDNGRTNEWSEPIMVPIMENEFVSARVDASTDASKPEIFILEVAYVNSKTGQQSEWTQVSLGVTYDNPPTYDVLPQQPVGPNAPAEDNRPIAGDNIAEYYGKLYECGLCHSCSVQPLGMCLWMFIVACIGLATTITCITLIIIDVVKRKRNKS